MTGASETNSYRLAELDALRGIVDAVPHPIFVKDDAHRFVLVNRSMCELMGHRYEDLVGRSDHDFVPKQQADGYLVADRAVLETGEVNETEEMFTDSAGGLHTIITRKNRLALADGTRLVVGCITDISAFRHAEAVIRYNAEHDGLTGLANRALFRRHLDDALSGAAAGEPAALLLIDLDGFKGINDGLGHAVGDDVLVHAARVITEATGSLGIAARLGGDEFGVLQRGTAQPDAASVLATEIIRSVAEPFMLGTHSVSISASIGIAPIVSGSDNPEILMRRADVALYRAKNEGRNAWRLFEAEMEASHLVVRVVEDDLRSAVRRDQLDVHYQPFVESSALRPLGFEALLRWNHPTRGPIEPSIFVPMAERIGLMPTLGEWVMRRACEEAVGWDDKLRVAVNVSAVQLAQVDLPRLIANVAAETGINPARIDIELTETAIIKDWTRARAVFDGLRDLGTHIVLDDFGAGYSSLQLLKSLRFDKIKLDRSLLHDVGRAPQADAIICSILDLVRRLGLAVTVEGVETEEQLAMLRQQGCTEMQGFLFGRPAPASVALAAARRPSRVAHVAHRGFHAA